MHTVFLLAEDVLIQVFKSIQPSGAGAAVSCSSDADGAAQQHLQPAPVSTSPPVHWNLPRREERQKDC